MGRDRQGSLRVSRVFFVREFSAFLILLFFFFWPGRFRNPSFVFLFLKYVLVG